MVRRYDDEVDDWAAWAIVRKVIADGEVVLRYKREEEWIELLDDWGKLIYESIDSQKYVDVN